MHIEIEKVSLKDISGLEIFVIGDDYQAPEDTNTYCNITQLGDTFVSTRLERDVTLDDVKKQRLDAMPGFRIIWYYLQGGRFVLSRGTPLETGLKLHYQVR